VVLAFKLLQAHAPGRTVMFPRISKLCQVAEGFALPAVTALSSFWFTALLLAAEHFRMLVPGVELPAIVGYVGAISNNFLHLTRDVFVH